MADTQTDQQQVVTEDDVEYGEVIIDRRKQLPFWKRSA